MNIVVTYLAYLVISVGLTLAVGRVLSRNGRVVLLDVLGGHSSPAEAVNNLIVVAFYLINLGFIVLTMRTTGNIATARQAIQLLATKIGEVLLVLGALYLANIVLLTRLRRRLRPQSPPASSGPPDSQPLAVPALGIRPPASARGRVSAVAPAGPPAGTTPQGFWRAAPRKVTS